MQKMMRISAGAMATGFVAALALAMSAIPAAAHHSFAMYDQTKSVTLTGKLTRFIPGANHAQLIFELVGPDGEPVLDESGKATVWGVETGPAGAIARQGVTVEGFPLGTVLSVTLNPLRNGKTFGVLDGAIVRCGMELPEGGCTAETGEVFLGDED